MITSWSEVLVLEDDVFLFFFWVEESIRSFVRVLFYLERPTDRSQ